MVTDGPCSLEARSQPAGRITVRPATACDVLFGEPCEQKHVGVGGVGTQARPSSLLCLLSASGIRQTLDMIRMVARGSFQVSQQDENAKPDESLTGLAQLFFILTAAGLQLRRGYSKPFSFTVGQRHLPSSMGGRALLSAGVSLPSVGSLEEPPLPNPRAKKDRHTQSYKPPQRGKQNSGVVRGRRDPKYLRLNGNNGSWTNTDDHAQREEVFLKCHYKIRCLGNVHYHHKAKTGKSRPLNADARRFLEKAEKDGVQKRAQPYKLCAIPATVCPQMENHFHFFGYSDDGKAEEKPDLRTTTFPHEGNPDHVPPPAQPTTDNCGSSGTQVPSGDEKKTVMRDQFPPANRAESLHRNPPPPQTEANKPAPMPQNNTEVPTSTYGKSFSSNSASGLLQQAEGRERLAREKVLCKRKLRSVVEGKDECSSSNQEECAAPLRPNPDMCERRRIARKLIKMCDERLEEIERERKHDDGKEEKVPVRDPNWKPPPPPGPPPQPEPATEVCYGPFQEYCQELDCDEYHPCPVHEQETRWQTVCRRAHSALHRYREWQRDCRRGNRHISAHQVTAPNPGGPPAEVSPESPSANFITREVVIYFKGGAKPNYEAFTRLKRWFRRTLPWVQEVKRVRANDTTNQDRSGQQWMWPMDMEGYIFAWTSRRKDYREPHRVDKSDATSLFLIGEGYDSCSKGLIFDELLGYLRSWEGDEAAALQRRRPAVRKEGKVEMLQSFYDAVNQHLARCPRIDAFSRDNSAIVQNTLLFYIQQRLIDCVRAIQALPPITGMTFGRAARR